jgi:hypothetical protein
LLLKRSEFESVNREDLLLPRQADTWPIHWGHPNRHEGRGRANFLSSWGEMSIFSLSQTAGPQVPSTYNNVLLHVSGSWLQSGPYTLAPWFSDPHTGTELCHWLPLVSSLQQQIARPLSLHSHVRWHP